MTVTRGGKVCFVDSFGVSDVEAGTPMHADGLFNIASMTKSVTSVACMMLVEQGKLSLDDDVSPHIPELARER